VLDTFGVFFAELVAEGLFIVIVKVEACLGEDGVFLNHLVKDVDV